MRRLIEGIVEFRESRLPELMERFQELSRGQSPDTLFISCSDSRVVPNLLVSTDPGDLFVLRNVGNLIPPVDREGDSTGDLSEASAIEYAVSVLEVQNIIVCGHSGCGAMAALLADSPLPEMPNLARWLQIGSAAVARLKTTGPLDPALSTPDQLSQLNVLLQLEHLRTYPAVQESIAAGRLQVCGWWFHIARGEMYAYEDDSNRFEKIDRREANRLIERLKACTITPQT